MSVNEKKRKRGETEETGESGEDPVFLVKKLSVVFAQRKKRQENLESNLVQEKQRREKLESILAQKIQRREKLESILAQQIQRREKLESILAQEKERQEKLKKAFKSIEKSCECPLCFHTYSDPVSLKCGHTFCMACLRRLLSQGREKCPKCSRWFSSGDASQKNIALREVCEEVRKLERKDVQEEKNTTTTTTSSREGNTSSSEASSLSVSSPLSVSSSVSVSSSSSLLEEEDDRQTKRARTKVDGGSTVIKQVDEGFLFGAEEEESTKEEEEHIRKSLY